jgi:hypothetical protein
MEAPGDGSNLDTRSAVMPLRYYGLWTTVAPFGPTHPARKTPLAQEAAWLCWARANVPSATTTASKTGFISCFIWNDLQVTQVRPSRMRDTALRQQTFRFLRRTIPVKLTDWLDHTTRNHSLPTFGRNVIDLDQLIGRAPAKVARSPQQGVGEWPAPKSRAGRRVGALMF